VPGFPDNSLAESLASPTARNRAGNWVNNRNSSVTSAQKTSSISSIRRPAEHEQPAPALQQHVRINYEALPFRYP
jgi:hypothetical protein